MGRGQSTWFVEYTYRYDYYDEEENKWFKEEGTDAKSFECLKADIKKCIEYDICEDLEGTDYRNLKITIIDQYIENGDDNE